MTGDRRERWLTALTAATFASSVSLPAYLLVIESPISPLACPTTSGTVGAVAPYRVEDARRNGTLSFDLLHVALDQLALGERAGFGLALFHRCFDGRHERARLRQAEN